MAVVLPRQLSVAASSTAAAAAGAAVQLVRLPTSVNRFEVVWKTCDDVCDLHNHATLACVVAYRLNGCTG